MTIFLTAIPGQPTTVVVSRDAPRPAEACETAVVEARGAMLTWTVTDPTDGRRQMPDAAIFDVADASDWLPELYGAAAAEAIARVSASGPGARELVLLDDAATSNPATSQLGRDVLLLGHLAWASAWWPAGHTVPALSIELLRTEIALVTGRIDHLLDDDHATERALAAAHSTRAALEAAGAHPRLSDGARRLTAELTTLADTFGVELGADHAPSGDTDSDIGSAAAEHAPAASSRGDWALAAGGGSAMGDGLELARGSTPVRWADVPPQTIAADAETAWSLRQRGGSMLFAASVAAAPRAAFGRPDARPASLRSRFGAPGATVELELSFDGTGYAAAREVPPEVVLQTGVERRAQVWDARMAAEPGVLEDAAVRARVIAFAQQRLAHASAARGSGMWGGGCAEDSASATAPAPLTFVELAATVDEHDETSGWRGG